MTTQEAMIVAAIITSIANLYSATATKAMPTLKSNIIKSSAVVLFFIIVILTISLHQHAIFSLFTAESKQVTYYNADGYDIDISSIESDFHPVFYNYRFENFKIIKDGDTIMIESDLYWKGIEDTQQEFEGKVNGTGKYIDGNASIAYVVAATSTGEDWNGVIHFDLGSTGPIKGHFITRYKEGEQNKFGFGTINLYRKP